MKTCPVIEASKQYVSAVKQHKVIKAEVMVTFTLECVNCQHIFTREKSPNFTTSQACPKCRTKTSLSKKKCDSLIKKINLGIKANGV